MPRQAHGRSLHAAGTSRPPKRKPARSRNLDAFAIAEQENSTKLRVRRNRLGEVEEDSRDRNLPGTGDQDEDAHLAKRRRIHTQESRADEGDAGGDSDGEEWHLGVDGEDEDSDLDSEEAMGESDQERFEGFTFGGSTAPSSNRLLRPKDLADLKSSEDIDLQEGSQDDASQDHGSLSSVEDSLADNAVDLATALDMNEESEDEHKQLQWKASKSADRRHADPQNADHSDSSSSDYTSASDDGQSTLSVSDDGDLATGHNRLKSFVQGLEVNTPSDAPTKRSRPPVAVGDPSDYGLASSQKLTIADLLSSVTDPRLRESLKMLRDSEQRNSKGPTRGIPGKLEPPLPKRQQDRLDREAAYGKSKETLSRWIDTVKQNRRAEHISFPLPNPGALAALGTNQLMPVSQSDAVTPLESVIQNIMHESGLASKNDPSAEGKLQAFEELQAKKLPIEEVQMRRAELRKARDLMFREEIRARRINKIKSKAYRRVHRKERDKHAQEERAALAAAGALDSEDERERQDRLRAEERMGARHKESRWAKALKATGRAAWDEDARIGVNDMARKDDELRKRIEGKEPNRSDEDLSESSNEESSDDMSFDEYDEVEGLKLKQRLGELEMVDQADLADSRLSAMPFMRKAESARRAANEAEIDQTRRVLAGEKVEGESEDQTLAGTGGRRRFGQAQEGRTKATLPANGKSEFEEPLSDDETRLLSPHNEHAPEPVQEPIWKKVGFMRKATEWEPNGRKKEKGMPGNSENPWLSGPRNSKTVKTTDEPVISTTSVLQVAEKSVNAAKSSQITSKKSAIPQPTIDDLTPSSESEQETQGREAGSKVSAQRNEELVRMAFAGDDVFQAFSDEKKATVDDEGDQVVDTSLPGWGSWTGAGISKKEQRRATSRKTTTTIKGIDPSKRKDAKLDRVIINQKRLKKNAKYLAPELPHPFESRQQYERSLRLPLGPEWTTKTTFQDATKPRVLMKQGVIRPMERPIA